MTAFEERLGFALRDLADEVVPVSMLGLLQPREPQTRRPGRLVVLAAAAGIAVVVAVASLVLLRLDNPGVVDPVRHPPKVFRISGLESDAPGQTSMAITLTSESLAGAPAYLVLAGSGRVVALPPTRSVYAADSHRLAVNGRVLLRKSWGTVGPEYALVDLVSGRVRQMADADALFADLSADGATVAVYTDRDVRLVDLADSSRTVLRRLVTPVRTSVIENGSVGAAGVIGAVGWSPTGDLLSVHDGADIVVLDRSGAVRATLRGARLVNGAQSWAPDGRDLLVYDQAGARFSVREADGTGRTLLGTPRGGLRPMGWSGSRVVWLSGSPGDQKLLDCDLDARDCRTWMRFDVGAAGVEGVTWSSAYAGTARG